MAMIVLIEPDSMARRTAARMELNWAVAGLWVLALIGVTSIAAAGHAPRRLSIAATLTAVRAARLRSTSHRALRQRLRRAVLDGYRHRSSKKPYRWPCKKNPPSPGEPAITKATPAQVQRAKRLHASS